MGELHVIICLLQQNLPVLGVLASKSVCPRGALHAEVSVTGGSLAKPGVFFIKCTYLTIIRNSTVCVW